MRTRRTALRFAAVAVEDVETASTAARRRGKSVRIPAHPATRRALTLRNGAAYPRGSKSTTKNAPGRIPRLAAAPRLHSLQEIRSDGSHQDQARRVPRQERRGLA